MSMSMYMNDIIQTCTSQNNLATIMQALPTHFHEMMSHETLMRTIKRQMNAVLALFEQEYSTSHTYTFAEAKGAVVSIDRKVHLGVTAYLGSLCETHIDALPLSQHSVSPSQLLERVHTPPIGASCTGSSIVPVVHTDGDASAFVRPVPPTDPAVPVASVDGILTITSDLPEYEACLDASPRASIEIIDVILKHMDSPVVTKTRRCFYFAEDDHPMHTINVPIKLWSSMDALTAWLSGEMNRVGSCSYRVVWLKAEQRVKISGSATFSLLFEQTPNGIHRVLGFARRNHKGKSQYTSDIRTDQSVKQFKICINGVSWTKGDSPRAFVCPDDRTVLVKTLDEHGSTFDYGTHTVKMRHAVSQALTNPFSPLSS